MFNFNTDNEHISTLNSKFYFDSYAGVQIHTTVVLDIWP